VLRFRRCWISGEVGELAGAKKLAAGAPFPCELRTVGVAIHPQRVVGPERGDHAESNVADQFKKLLANLRRIHFIAS
jgi:hypothetical protein